MSRVKSIVGIFSTANEIASSTSVNPIPRYGSRTEEACSIRYCCNAAAENDLIFSGETCVDVRIRRSQRTEPQTSQTS